MAENQEKTEAELLEEAMQNLGLEEVVEEVKSDEVLVEGGSSKLTDEDIKSLIEDDEDNSKEEETNISKEEPNVTDEISAVEDINLNNIPDKDLANETDGLELDEDYPVQKKQNKILRILIIFVSILLTLVSVGAVLYFIGFFDPEPVKEVKKEEIKPQKEEYKFNTKDIDTNRLNKKLNLLTKYEIVENPNIEEEKRKEKEKLYLEAKKQLEMERLAQIEKIKEAERKRMAEELPAIQKQDINENIDKEIEKVIDKEEVPTQIKEEATVSTNEQEPQQVEDKTTNEDANTVTQTNIENTPSNTTPENEKKVEETTSVVVENTETKVEPTPVKEEVAVAEEKPKESQFVKIIKIATKSKDIYKSYLDKIYSVSDDVTLCRDYQNNVEIFIGPFEDDSSRSKISQEYLSKYNIKVEEYDYTKDEYTKRCNY
ncbi:hypothetical protein [Arcobacter sp.]|uniref:hypothetical protein n=1 Tax=Arcobacter sp. TaxID=1872629 RepID=UPI003D0D4ABE